MDIFIQKMAQLLFRNENVTLKKSLLFAMMKSYRIGDDFELRNIRNVMLRNDIQKHLWSIDRSIFGSIGEYLNRNNQLSYAIHSNHHFNFQNVNFRHGHETADQSKYRNSFGFIR